MNRRHLLLVCGALSLVAACGGGGAAPEEPAGPAAIGTLAYVVTECREGPEGRFSRQTLFIRQGEEEPAKVMELPWSGPLAGVGQCASLGLSRFGLSAVFGGAFQRIGVSPDGSMVAFEVTDDFALNSVDQLARDDQEGIYVVRADGTGLSRLAPASREAGFRIVPDPALPTGFFGTLAHTLGFSPDGQKVALTDLGPGPSGEEAPQVVTIDLTTGERRQVTRLPRGVELPYAADLRVPTFFGDDRIAFFSNANPEGLNPGGTDVAFTVRSDGAALQVVPFPAAAPSGTIVPAFVVSEGGVLFGNFFGEGGAVELASFTGTGFLQLTNFRRDDTATLGAFGSSDGRTVFFSASANPPLGTNLSNSCQLFSIDSLGGDLRQLTFFEPGSGAAGCVNPILGFPGCTVSPVNWFVASSQDARTGTVVFYSSCDPEGGVSTGGEIYAMRPDRSGLRALTETRGMFTADDGTLNVELPGPHAYGPHR